MRALLLVLLIAASPAAATEILRGAVESAGNGLAGYRVSLIASFAGTGRVSVLGRATTDASGAFEIVYRDAGLRAPGLAPVLFVLAERDASTLASAIAGAPLPAALGPVAVNERTTVATGFAFAQFVGEAAIAGNRYGMLNAVRMAANMADPATGALGAVLANAPNGSETSALATFDSLANAVAACVASDASCNALLDAATPPGGPRPASVLQALANVARYPWNGVGALFALSLERPVYQPALPAGSPPDAWTLFLKFTGSFSSEQNATNLMNGPGNFAIDEAGFLWVSNNYTPIAPELPACDGRRVLKFHPWGENAAGSPFFGGGISGDGYGVTLAPDGHVWLGNFGFSGVGCPEGDPPANSVTELLPDGTPVSPDGTGYTAGPVAAPQGVVADRKGNIWIANCASDSVTVYRNGDPGRAVNTPFPLAANDVADSDLPVVKPFAIAIDRRGNAWVTGNLNDTLAVFGPTGAALALFTAEHEGRQILTRPVGVASDSKGNVWIANSDWLDNPCTPLRTLRTGAATNPSIALFVSDPAPRPHEHGPFTGGGMTIPWGVAVDGNDTVWVANFGFPFDLAAPDDAPQWTELPRVSHFCGADPSKCPPTKQAVGMAISPDVTGYTTDALTRNTGLAIDPSGNVWLVNNWKEVPRQRNPGDNAIVVLVGAAAPVKTPVIGTPSGF